jgi:predicted nicotinamide N-methyase
MPKVKYPTLIRQRLLGDKLFVLEAIRDLDEAIDIICDSMSEDQKLDPFAEDLCPYFGVLWPAAEGLSIFLQNHADLVKGKKVLELGCGLGYPSLVASYLGAQVLATDFHPDVEEYFKRNCRHSVIPCDYQRLNWREDQKDIGLFDVVMGSDVLYESKHPRDVARGLKRFLASNGKILLADPGRAYLQQFLSAAIDEGMTYEESIVLVEEKTILLHVLSEKVEAKGHGRDGHLEDHFSS